MDWPAKMDVVVVKVICAVVPSALGMELVRGTGGAVGNGGGIATDVDVLELVDATVEVAVGGAVLAVVGAGAGSVDDDVFELAGSVDVGAIDVELLVLVLAPALDELDEDEFEDVATGAEDELEEDELEELEEADEAGVPWPSVSVSLMSICEATVTASDRLPALMTSALTELAANVAETPSTVATIEVPSLESATLIVLI